MEIPTGLLTADPHTNAELQGNLLRDYEHKFEQFPEDQKLSKLCSDAGLMTVEKGQFFVTPEEGPDWWVPGKPKIGPVLDVKVCFHQKRYGIEIMVESLFRDRSVLGSNCEWN